MSTAHGRRTRLTLGEPSALKSRRDVPGAERTVLVVDDFPAVLAWAARAFTRAGWTVLTATDGQEALDRWRVASDSGRPVRVLVTDLELPEWGGASLTERLRAEDADLPVLALHTGERDAVTWPALQMNRTAFFQKPVRAAVLLDTATALMAARGAVVALEGDELCPVEPVGALVRERL